MEKQFKEIVEILFKSSCENYDNMPHTDGLEILENLKTYLTNFPIDVEIQKYIRTEGGKEFTHANLIAKNKVNNDKYIALQGHIDTVPCNEKYFYKLTKSEIIGRGAVDMKGPLVGALLAFLEIVKAGSKNVMLIITDDEETNFQGINELVKRKDIIKNISFVINAEPTNMKPAFLNRGFGQYEITIPGWSGHSSSIFNTFLIENSTKELLLVNKYLETIRGIKSIKLGTTVAAFTMLNSGTKSNQLPVDCKMVFNFRTVDKKEKYQKLFKSLVKNKLKTNVQVKEFYMEPFDSSINVTVRKVLKIAFKKNNFSYRESIMNAMTELYMFENAGIPGFVFGPGDMNLAHVQPKDERIKIKDIIKFSKIISSLVSEL